MSMATNVTFASSGVDTIIRCHDPGRFAELDRTLFALLHQSYGPVHPIIVTQGFSDEPLHKLRGIAESHKWEQFGHTNPTIVNVPNANNADMRAHLLNIGLLNVRSRYFAILDSDDYLYSYAYEYLVDELRRTSAAIAFGNISRKDVRAFNDFVYTRNHFSTPFIGNDLADLVIDNFCPIHSFVLDRSAVNAMDLRFDDTLARLEDYEFLLRICAQYPASFSSRKRTIGVYNWHLDGRASNQFAESDEKARTNLAAWNQARRQIWRLKRELFGSSFKAELNRPRSVGGSDS